MTPVQPPPYEGERQTIFAKEQAEYISLPASIDAQGCVTTEWEPSEEELTRLIMGGRVRLCVHTFDPMVGQPGHELQPVSLDVLEPELQEVRES